LAHQTPQPQPQIWTLYTEGAWGHPGVGAFIVLIAPSGLPTKYAVRLEFKATNNIVEYEGLKLGLNKAKALGAKTILAKTDSQVVAGQVKKEYMAREPELVKYLAIVRALEWRFLGFTLNHIPRAENAEADELAKVAANNLPIPEGVFFPNITSISNASNYEDIQNNLSH
jgi:ribonuclease HI